MKEDTGQNGDFMNLRYYLNQQNQITTGGRR